VERRREKSIKKSGVNRCKKSSRGEKKKRIEEKRARASPRRKGGGQLGEGKSSLRKGGG